MVIVLVAGMYRSGSTFSFNIVKGILENRGKVHQQVGQDILAAAASSEDADHLILKSHVADETMFRMVELGAIKAVCTVRKPEDAIASLMETFNISLHDATHQTADWIRMFSRFKKHSLVVRYEEIDTQPLKATQKIAKYLYRNAGYFECRRLAAANAKSKIKEKTDSLVPGEAGVVDVKFSYYDSKTLLHRRHISSLVSRPASERIGSDAVAKIRDDLKNYIDRDGNILLNK